MAKSPKGIEGRVSEVFELNREFIELSGSGVVQKLGPPASESAIQAYEKKLGFSLPPSYRTFLSLHDGWEGFEGDIRLLSIREMTRGEYAEWIKEVKQDAWEDGETLLIEGLIIGIDLDSTSCYVLDRAKVNEQGEMPVVNWDDEVIARYKDFAAMLDSVAKDLKKLIRYEQKKKKAEGQ
jgi:hypothetical protein